MAAGGEDAELGAAFADHARALMARRFLWLGGFLLVAAVLWWPVDWLFMPEGSPEAAIQSRARLGLIVLIVAYLAVARFVPGARRAPVVTGAAAVFAGIAYAARHLALLGGVDSPWFSFQFFVPFLTVAYLGPLGPRTGLTAANSALMFGVFAASRPAHLAHPLLGVALAQLFFAVAFSVAVGHALYGITRREYEQRRRLSALNETLEERAAAQTLELRALTQRLTTVVQEERAYMAREVHDQLGQELTAMRYAIAFARGRAADAPGPVRAAFDELDQLLGSTRETTRRIIGRLRPRLLEDLGFVQAARQALDDHRERTGMAVRFSATPEGLALPAAVATSLFEVLLEALTNVARHSRARHVTVAVAQRDGRLRLVVEDDGVGPREVRSASPPSVGLIGVRERAGALNGSATWGPGDGGGFRLAVEVPLPGPPVGRSAGPQPTETDGEAGGRST